MLGETKLPPSSTPAQPLLTSVQSIAHSQPTIEGVPHIVALVSSFLDVRLVWDIPRACALGDVALLRFIARQEEVNATPWTKDEPLYRPWRFSSASVVAARMGNIEVLRWLLTEYDTESILGKAVEEAAAFGHLDVIEWLHENFFERTFWSGDGITKAVANNHLETAQWLAANTTSRACDGNVSSIAEFGSIEMVKWLKTTGARATIPAITIAAKHGHLDAIQLMVRLWDLSVTMASIDSSATAGHLDVAKWLHDNGASCSADAVNGAAANGHLHVLEWLHKKKIA